jgi:glycosyltransferase involved in cell wall biosynthesis
MASNDVAKLLAGEPFILYLGRLNWKKGIDRLIAAMVAVPGYRLVIVGNDEENYKDTLLAEIERYHLGKRVFVLDRFVAGADKRALYEAASLFVLPSLSENFGITVTEALANGCPVVVTNGVGASEVVLQSGGGRVCSGAELGQTMQAFLADSAALAEAGQRGKAWVLENLGWNSIARQMVAEYRRFSPVPCEKDVKP